MEFKEIVAISGKGGLFQAQTQRADGMIVTSLTDGKTGFVPSRKHMFTPLESITIYTEDDSEDLVTVLQNMKKKSGELKLPDTAKASGDELRDFFRKVLPAFDEERVYLSDIKKIIKWYSILDEKGVAFEIKKDKEDKEEKEEKAEAKKSEVKEAKKPAAKPKAKAKKETTKKAEGEKKAKK